MNFTELEKISGGKILQLRKDHKIVYLLTDSRKVLVSEEALFFAIAGERHDGHSFIESLYQSGIRQFVVERKIDDSLYPEANFLFVSSAVHVLQSIVASHRKQFTLPVIGITGSNGKTIIKEWLYQLLSPNFRTVKNPGSYNSQIGVPLSVWQLQAYHQLGIFEAGISQPHEMERLEAVIQPTIGLFSNIGSAHDKGFQNTEEKIREKIKLFSNAEAIIYCKDHAQSATIIEGAFANKKLVSWGKAKTANVQIQIDNGTSQITWASKTFHL